MVNAFMDRQDSTGERGADIEPMKNASGSDQKAHADRTKPESRVPPTAPDERQPRMAAATEEKQPPESPAIVAVDAPASVDLNALHKVSPEELVELGKKFGLFL